MLVLIWKLLLSTFIWVPMGQGFDHFSGFLHHFVLAKVATSSIRVNTLLPAIFLGMDAWMTPQLNIALIRKLCGSLMCLDYFCHVIHGCLYHQALADVQATSTGIKCLRCIMRLASFVWYIVFNKDEKIFIQHYIFSSSFWAVLKYSSENRFIDM